MVDLRYPIGRFQPPQPITEAHRTEAIRQIASLPSQFRTAISALSEPQLETPYRPGGWTVRQLVHHLPDSHMNAYIRFKQAITEDEPTVKPYDEAVWAELPEARSAPVEVSLRLLESLHARWVMLLPASPPEWWARNFRHPEYEQPVGLDRTLLMYAWHGNHHLAHVTSLVEREGWIILREQSKPPMNTDTHR